jgi:predicted phosphate transport protein (TIGR00153 family)
MFFSKSAEIMELVGEHSSAVVACYDKYEEAITAICNGCEEGAVEAYTNQLRSLESQADEIRHQIIRRLLEGGLLVDSRKSLMHVLEALDGIADIAEDVIQEIYMQNMSLPELVHEPILKMTEVTKRQLLLLIETIKSIVHKYEIKEMIKMIQEIEQMESEVDAIQQSLVKQLYRSDMGLAEKNQIRELVNMIGSMSDRIEDISDQVEIIMMARKV